MSRRAPLTLLTLLTTLAAAVATLGAIVVVAAPAEAALCPNGQRAVSFDVSTGSGALGAPDPRWNVSTPTGVPLVETTTPAFAVAPAPGWVSPAGWVSSTGAGTGVAAPASAVTRSYQTAFVAAPLGFATISLSYAAADDVTWHVNGQIVGSATAAAGSWHTLTVTTPFIRGAHNILEAKVTNHGGTEGLAVRGLAWSCV